MRSTPLKQKRHRCRRVLATLFAAAPVSAAVSMLTASPVYGQRVMGLDTSSAANGTAPSQTLWNTAFSQGYKFAWVRSSRGGTSDSTRLDDAQFYSNITRATAAGMLAGSYHYARPDAIATHTATDDANHYLERAGMYMKPGYLLPVFDLEDGDLEHTPLSLANWGIEFLDRIEAVTGVVPIVYSNSNYAVNEVHASLAWHNVDATNPVQHSNPRTYQWLARPGSNGLTGNPPPASNIPNPYGVFDPNFGSNSNSRDPAVKPWAFWQQTLDHTPAGLFKIDTNYANGNIEFVKDFLVPALWTTSGSGDWTTVANWNSDNTAYNGTIQSGPAPRLPNSLDWIKLQNPSGGAVTIPNGSQSVRKLYTAQPLSIAGGASLTVGYIPGSGGKWDLPAEFASAVNVGNGNAAIGAANYTAHTTQVNASGGQLVANAATLTFRNIDLVSHSTTPGKMTLHGTVGLAPHSLTGTAVVRSIGNGAQTGFIELPASASVRTLNVSNGPSAVDVSIQVPMTGIGGFTKSGLGTLQLAATNTYAGATSVNQGTLRITKDANLGTAPASPQTGHLSLNGGRLQTGTEINSISLTNAGTGYTSFPTVAINGAGPDNSPAAANVLAGINSIAVTNGGSGYVNQGGITPSPGSAGTFVDIIGGGGTGATARAVVSGGVVTGIVITNSGTGYTSMPTIHISSTVVGGFGGSGAAASVNGITLQGLALTERGFDYASPTVSLVGGGGTGATAAATSTPNWALADTRSLQVGPSGAELFQTAGSTLTYAGPITSAFGAPAGSFTKSGPGTLVLGGASTHAGTKFVTGGTLIAANADALATGALNISTGATAQAQADLPKALSVASVTTAGTGKLDLTNNDLVVKNSTVTAVQALITAGFNGGDWLGGGITSSVAATDPNGFTALGYLSNADLGATEFSGVTVDADDVLVKYTYYGDADLSGAVTLDDYSQFLFGFQNPVTASWSVGDFDYSGTVTLDDFSVFLLVFQSQGGPLGGLAEAVIGADGISEGNRAAMLNAIAAVPEPGTLGVLLFTGIGMLRRRRTR